MKRENGVKQMRNDRNQNGSPRENRDLVSLLIAFALLWVPQLALADIPSPEYLKDQFIVELPTSHLLEERTVQAVKDAAQVPLETVAKTGGVVLMGKPVGGFSSSADGAPEIEEEIVTEEDRLCVNLSKRYRQAKLNARASGDKKPIRRVRCIQNELVYADVTPNDRYYGICWGQHQSSDIDMNLPEAWGLTTGDSNTVIAVIDTGIDYNHPDLRNNMWVNPGEIPNNGRDDDGNGWVDDVHGVNAIRTAPKPGDPMDDHGHGTHVAGTIGAEGNNSIGVAGGSWKVKMIGIKFLSASGSGSLFDAITAIEYANDLKEDYGINIILTNNSWGGGGYFSAMRAAIERAKGLGILFVAAAGNAANNNDSRPAYPATYPNENIISVAAVDSKGKMASFSSYGKTTVDIGAPGVSIASTYPGNRYVYMSGTSMATPNAAGVLALMYSYAPYLEWNQLKDTLLNTGRPLASLNNKVLTGDMVDAYAALRNVPPPLENGPTPTPTPGPTSQPTPTPTPTPNPSPTPTPTPGVFSITGQVTYGGSETPLAQARVEFRTAGETLVRFTGPNGNYQFPEIDGPVDYTIVATHSGTAFSSVSGYLTKDTVHNLNGTIRRYWISGTVVSQTGEPFSGVLISGGSLGNYTTGNDGKFYFYLPYSTEYRFTASHQDLHFERPEMSGTVWGAAERLVVGLPN